MVVKQKINNLDFNEIEDELKKNKQFYRDLIEYAPEAVLIHENNEIIYANSSAIKFFDASSTTELLRKDMKVLIHPDSSDVFDQRLSTLTNEKGQVPFIGEKYLTLKGKEVIAAVKAIPIQIKNKPAVMVIIHNITDRKLIDEDRYKLAAIVDSSDDAIISKNLKGIIRSWNKSAQDLFGYTPLEAIGKSILMLIPKELQSEEPVILGKIKRGENIHHYETVRVRKDGSRVDVSLSISPVRDSSGTIIGAAKIVRDITQRKLIDRKKDDFIGIASHELKTPLTSIKGYTQILERIVKETKNEKATVLLSKINLYINRLNSLISDLLDVSKIQAGKMLFNMEKFDIDTLMNEGIDAIQPTTAQHIISLKERCHQTIMGDKIRLEQVFINLLNNAVKYSPNADKIDIMCHKKDNEVIVEIKDYGVGIPKSGQKRLFERFYRVEQTSHQFSGMGIGLYISAEIIKRHNGKIWFESVPDKGSSFFFSLPISN